MKALVRKNAIEECHKACFTPQSYTGTWSVLHLQQSFLHLQVTPELDLFYTPPSYTGTWSVYTSKLNRNLAFSTPWSYTGTSPVLYTSKLYRNLTLAILPELYQAPFSKSSKNFLYLLSDFGNIFGAIKVHSCELNANIRSFKMSP